MNKIMRIAAVSTIILLAGVAGMWAEAEEALPEGLRGFSGQVSGVVVSKDEQNTFTFKVVRVLQVWKNNKAETPEALAGRTVPVGPRWSKGENGQWHPVEAHVAFIRKIETGQEITLEIQNVERSHFAILELSAEQRQIGQGEDVKRDRPTESENEADMIKNLKEENRRLKAEVTELRNLLKGKND